jgi:hypothetical protein
MSPRGIASRVIDVALVVVMCVVGAYTVVRLFAGEQASGVAGLVLRLGKWVLAPFEGLFGVENFLVTALIGVLGYCLLAALAHAAAQVLPSVRRRVVDERAVPVRRVRARDGA